MVLRKNGLTTKLRWEIPTISFAVEKTPDGGVGLPELSKRKWPSVLAGETNLTALASAYKTAFSRGETY